MPADTLTLPISPEQAADIRAKAEARGVSVEQVAQEALQIGLDVVNDEAEDLSWEEDLRRLEEPGANIPLDEAFDEMRAHLLQRIADQKS